MFIVYRGNGEIIVTDTAGEAETLRHFFFGSTRKLAHFVREEVDDSGFRIDTFSPDETYPW